MLELICVVEIGGLRIEYDESLFSHIALAAYEAGHMNNSIMTIEEATKILKVLRGNVKKMDDFKTFGMVSEETYELAEETLMKFKKHITNAKRLTINTN